jgi:CBS domain-containing protein
MRNWLKPSKRQPGSAGRLSPLERTGQGAPRTPGRASPPPVPGSRPWVPDVRVLDRKDEILIFLGSPEIDARKIGLRLSGRRLTFSGASVADIGGHPRYHAFRRNVVLPETLDPGRLRAHATEHLLVVRLRKRARSASRSVPAVTRAPLRVRDVMSREVRSVGPEATALEAAALLGRYDIGSVPVSSEGMVVGVLTDRDLALRVTARDLDPATVKVRDVMTPDPVACTPDLPLADAERAMADLQVRRLPVVDRAGTLVGYLSMSRVAWAEGDHRAAYLIRGVSRPGKPLLLRPASGR